MILAKLWYELCKSIENIQARNVLFQLEITLKIKIAIKMKNRVVYLSMVFLNQYITFSITKINKETNYYGYV